MTGTRKFYVVYTNHKNGFETDELDFGPDEEVSQQTVAEKLRSIHSGWYDRLDLNIVISWSEIIEKPTETL
jgi:hypothetical protein